MIHNVLKVLMDYEDVENRSNRLNRGHIDNMPITKCFLLFRRLLS